MKVCINEKCGLFDNINHTNNCKMPIKIENCKDVIMSEGGSSSCPSSIQRQQKCDNCMIGYYDFCHEAWLIYKEEESKYDKDDVGITWFKYCPACGYETNLAD